MGLRAPAAVNSQEVMLALPRSVPYSAVPTVAPVITSGLAVAQSAEARGLGFDIAVSAAKAPIPAQVAAVPSDPFATTSAGRFLGSPPWTTNLLHMKAILPPSSWNPLA